jgi:hypothetical protein
MAETKIKMRTLAFNQGLFIAVILCHLIRDYLVDGTVKCSKCD